MKQANVGAEDGVSDALFKFTRLVYRQLLLVSADGKGQFGFARVGNLAED